jgi:hypothetical protein
LPEKHDDRFTALALAYMAVLEKPVGDIAIL